jgi:hypothetical protein
MWSLYCINVPASEYIPVYYAVNSQKKLIFEKLLEAHERGYSRRTCTK